MKRPRNPPMSLYRRALDRWIRVRVRWQVRRLSRALRHDGNADLADAIERSQWLWKHGRIASANRLLEDLVREETFRRAFPAQTVLFPSVPLEGQEFPP